METTSDSQEAEQGPQSSEVKDEENTAQIPKAQINQKLSTDRRTPRPSGDKISDRCDDDVLSRSGVEQPRSRHPSGPNDPAALKVKRDEMAYGGGNNDMEDGEIVSRDGGSTGNLAGSLRTSESDVCGGWANETTSLIESEFSVI